MGKRIGGIFTVLHKSWFTPPPLPVWKLWAETPHNKILFASLPVCRFFLFSAIPSFFKLLELIFCPTLRYTAAVLDCRGRWGSYPPPHRSPAWGTYVDRLIVYLTKRHSTIGVSIQYTYLHWLSRLVLSQDQPS